VERKPFTGRTGNCQGRGPLQKGHEAICVTWNPFMHMVDPDCRNDGSSPVVVRIQKKRKRICDRTQEKCHPLSQNNEHAAKEPNRILPPLPQA
jgi:hypothetical protein